MMTTFHHICIFIQDWVSTSIYIERDVVNQDLYFDKQHLKLGEFFHEFVRQIIKSISK